MNTAKCSPYPFSCDSCYMRFSNRKMFEIHQKQQSHIINEKAHGPTAEPPPNIDKVGIYVRGYPEKTQEADLVKYFSQFGNVIWVHFGHDFLLLNFTEAAAVDKVMSKNAHFLHGSRLTVRHKAIRTSKKAPTNEEEENENLYRTVISSLEPCKNFEEEFLQMARTLQPNVAESFKKYNLICQDLYNFLSEEFPYIQVHPFGSTLTGLGFNNSDIDVFLSNVKRNDDDEIKCLNVIKRLLARSQRFANCFVIPSAKIPIVKCIHMVTGIRCDLNIKNMLGVCNSKLIHYYLSIDIKIKEAMMILKYWGKCHKITGQNHLLTNYSLTLMFIFFLQQQPYNFPTVFSLQQPENQQFLNIQESWNGGFVPNYHFHSDKMTSTPVLDIVEQFFGYYTEFPYDKQIICPYLGKPLPKTYFQGDLPDCFKRYKNYLVKEGNIPLKTESFICIQDPFEHSRNVTSAIAEPVLEKLIAYCKLGKTICKEQNQVLHKLLTEEVPTLKKPKINYQDDFLEMTLHKSPKKVQEKWFDLVVEFITVALQDFLFLSLTNHSDEISPSKNSRNERQSDVHDTNKLSFTCAGKTNMWHARKATAKQLNLTHGNTTLIEREKAITKHLKEIYKNFQDTADILSFKITLENRKTEAFISVEKVTAYKKSFKSFAMFFAANIPLWFELYEREVGKGGTEVKSA